MCEELQTEDILYGALLRVLHVASINSSLRGYVYIELPYAWQKITDLENV